uniref:BTB domain-containing protein n=1 Tax=Heterosigma akashiwo TaxID=2829 RepID=A0A7S3UTM2_HETAK
MSKSGGRRALSSPSIAKAVAAIESSAQKLRESGFEPVLLGQKCVCIPKKEGEWEDTLEELEEEHLDSQVRLNLVNDPVLADMVLVVHPCDGAIQSNPQIFYAHAAFLNNERAAFFQALLSSPDYRENATRVLHLNLPCSDRNVVVLLLNYCYTGKLPVAALTPQTVLKVWANVEYLGMGALRPLLVGYMGRHAQDIFNAEQPRAERSLTEHSDEEDEGGKGGGGQHLALCLTFDLLRSVLDHVATTPGRRRLSAMEQLELFDHAARIGGWRTEDLVQDFRRWLEETNPTPMRLEDFSFSDYEIIKKQASPQSNFTAKLFQTKKGLLGIFFLLYKKKSISRTGVRARIFSVQKMAW